MQGRNIVGNYRTPTQRRLEGRQPKRLISGWAYVNGTLPEKGENVILIKWPNECYVSKCCWRLGRSRACITRYKQGELQLDVGEQLQILAFIPKASCGYRLEPSPRGDGWAGERAAIMNYVQL